MTQFDIIGKENFNPATFPLYLDSIPIPAFDTDVYGSEVLGRCIYNIEKAMGMKHNEKEFLSYFSFTDFSTVTELFRHYYKLNDEGTKFIFDKESIEYYGGEEFIITNAIICEIGQEGWDDWDDYVQSAMIAYPKYFGHDCIGKLCEMVGDGLSVDEFVEYHYDCAEDDEALGMLIAEESCIQDEIDNSNLSDYAKQFITINYEDMGYCQRMEKEHSYVRLFFGKPLYESCGWFFLKEVNFDKH